MILLQFQKCNILEPLLNLTSLSVAFFTVAGQNWGRVDSLRYDCCFICVDALLPALDEYVEKRVDCMIDAGLLEEVYNIYKFNADYTRGLRQAIGVREFKNFLCTYVSDVGDLSSNEQYKGNIKVILDRPISDGLKLLLEEAVGRMKLNTRRLVRRQVGKLSPTLLEAFLVQLICDRCLLILSEGKENCIK